ncbi:hypothetical protein TNCV_1366071 [Trichonephila clavipes]|nr:hypothetical protein TNCV_1366071 [Trichonephila clavipes]
MSELYHAPEHPIARSILQECGGGIYISQQQPPYYGDHLGIVVKVLGLRNQSSQVLTIICDPGITLKQRKLQSRRGAIYPLQEQPKAIRSLDAAQQSCQIHMT